MWCTFMLLALAGTPSGQAVPGLEVYDDYFQALVGDDTKLAVQVAVGRGGRVIYSRGFGWAEPGVPLSPDGLFRIASISKPVTSAAVMQLVDQGRLSLDDNIVDRLALSPKDERWRAITLRHLLQHRGGFDRDKSGDPMFKSRQIAADLALPPPADGAAILRWMVSQPLDYTPGERYAYSNFGYMLLGMVIEKVTGVSYEAYCQEHIWRAVGSTRPRLGRSLLAGRAPGEVLLDGAEPPRASVFGAEAELVPTPYGTFYFEPMAAHGGWLASAADLVRFAQAFDDAAHSPLLRPASIAATFARPDAGTDPVWYGLGWSVRDCGQGRLNTWHTGGIPGTSTLLVRRWDGLDWAVLFNRRSDANGKDYAGIADGAMHELAAKVKTWPADRQPVL
ncbi:MAG: beta-lactamase family protein [Armatimonadetes bacterium]|nr:beta-lactamase family protein [Armatimonadota bacterium]